MREPDFIPLDDLCDRTGYDRQTFYNSRNTGRGPLAGILTKLGNRVGVWRPDYEAWLRSQRRLPDVPADKQAAA
jgi:hypothetical protein